MGHGRTPGSPRKKGKKEPYPEQFKNLDNFSKEKDYPCEWCQGLGPFRRKRCPKCKKLFCKHHINDHECVEPMIEIIDKINNTIKKVPDSIEVIIDPAGNPIFLGDFQMEGQKIYCAIHKEDGTTLFCYKNLEVK